MKVDDPAIENIYEILNRISEGDQKAFTLLVDGYWGKVYGHAMAYVKSSPRAYEITQDVFLLLWNKREKLTGVLDFKNYLFILGRNLIISGMRKKLMEPVSIEPVDIAEEAFVPDRQLQYKQVYQELMKGIDALPPTRQKIFKMSRLEGSSYAEIAQAMNISKHTVKEHMTLALNFLRRWMHANSQTIIPLLSPFLIN